MPADSAPTISFRVACFSPYPAAGPSVRHRIKALAPLWRAEGIAVTLMPFMSTRFYKIRKRFDTWGTCLKLAYFVLATIRTMWRVLWVFRFDAVIIHREAFPLGPAWFERVICALNRHVIFDVDDAIWVPPSMALNQRKWLSSPNRVADIMRRCKSVAAGNAFLADYARTFCANVEIIPTSFQDLAPAAIRRADALACPCILWIGNEGNATYLNLVLPVLENVAAMFPFRLRLVGGTDIAQIRATNFEIEYCPWSEEWESEWIRSADIGIMPLFDAPYEHGKCGFKLIQYWSAGLPVIATPIGVNKTYVVPDVNGYLAATDAQWEAAFTALVAPPHGRATRARLGQAGRASYLAAFTRERAASRWLDLFARAGWCRPAQTARSAKALSC